MSLFEDIIDSFVELGCGIKDATVELGEDLFEIVTEDIPNDLTEIGNDIIDLSEKAGEKASEKIDDMVDMAIDAAAAHASGSIVKTVTSILKKMP